MTANTPGRARMDLFERQWQTYRSVVDHDWMEHRGITAAWKNQCFVQF